MVMTQPTPTAAPPALLNITLGVMLALMLGWFFHIASGVLVPMVLGLMISYVVMPGLSAAVSFCRAFHLLQGCWFNRYARSVFEKSSPL